MMGQLAGLQERLFYEFRLDDWVPTDHLLRKIDGVLDLAVCVTSSDRWAVGRTGPARRSP